MLYDKKMPSLKEKIKEKAREQEKEDKKELEEKEGSSRTFKEKETKEKKV